MAKKDIREVLKQETVTVKDKYLQVKTFRDGYTRTHEGQYSYKVVEQGTDLFLFPVQTDGKGVLKVMKNSPIAYTDGDNIHFVVNTLTDPYTQAFIRTEDIKGLDKGKQLIQAFLAFVEDRFRFGVYNVFVADTKADVMSLIDPEDKDADEVKEVNETAHEDLVAQFPTGNAREDVKGVDSGEGQGDTSENKPEEPKDPEVTPGEEDAEVKAD
uniref:Ig domain containing protein n=1 Tax=Mammaliicoccus phage MSShimriz1 TaxID=3230127 RepID=A0AAU8GRT9_9VIRU